MLERAIITLLTLSFQPVLANLCLVIPLLQRVLNMNGAGLTPLLAIRILIESGLLALGLEAHHVRDSGWRVVAVAAHRWCLSWSLLVVRGDLRKDGREVDTWLSLWLLERLLTHGRRGSWVPWCEASHAGRRWRLLIG